MKKVFLTTVLGAMTASVFTGCASTQNVPIANIHNISKKEAIIQVHRKSNFVGSGRKVDIYDFDKKIGEIANDGTLTWSRPAGKTCLGIKQTNFIESSGAAKCFIAKGGKVTKLNFHYSTSSFTLVRGDSNESNIN